MYSFAQEQHASLPPSLSRGLFLSLPMYTYTHIFIYFHIYMCT